MSAYSVGAWRRERGAVRRVSLMLHVLHSLDLQYAEALALGDDLPRPVAVLVDGEAVGVESKLFGHLEEPGEKHSVSQTL